MVLKNKRIVQESNSNICPLCGGETVVQRQANFLRWCEIPDGNVVCRYCNKCGNVFMLTEKIMHNESLSNAQSQVNE